MVILNVEGPSGTVPNTIRVPIDARGIIENLDGKHWEVNPAPFAAPIPVPKGTKLRSLRIEDVAGNVLSGEPVASGSTPSVTILSPKPNEKLGAQTTIAWLGSHLMMSAAGDTNDGRPMPWRTLPEPGFLLDIMCYGEATLGR